MKAIILAAGPGIRMRERTEAIPTCLMKVGKETILQRQIKILKKWGINEVLVVVGREGSCWTLENIKKIKKIAKEVIINPNNADTPSSSSLTLGLQHFKACSCLIIDGDLVFEEGIIKTIVKNKHKRLILVERVKAAKKGTYVKLKGDNVEAIGKNIKTSQRYGGLIKIDDKLYKRLKKELQLEENQNIEYTDILNGDLDSYKLKSIDVERIEGKVGDIFNFEPLTGGSFANTKVISKLVKKTDYVVRKEAIEGREKLIDEINWIKNLPPDLASFFPRIIDYKIEGKKVWYEMEYHNLPTLRSLIVNKTITKEEALYILKVLVKFIFSRIYNQRISKNTKDYAKRVHLKRIRERFIITAKRSRLMNKIINSEYVIINGKKFYNLPMLINWIEKDKVLLKRLEPPFLCMVHGDLHFDNFVTDISQMPMIKFTLLDPRGLDNTYSYCYDLGKLWHSFHGKYDLTHEGLFDMEYSFKENNFVVGIEFTDHELFSIYSYLYEEIKKFLWEIPLLKKDEEWELRTLFSEMSHFCSVMPFHMKYDEKERIAIALYIMGVKLANEFVERYCKPYKEEKPVKGYININSPEDYDLTKRIFK